jgi:hypothetical protein
MSTITTLQTTDLITNSRATINTNFSNLNTDKIETSVLDTDTALTANSDVKIATQKAVKAYVDGSQVTVYKVGSSSYDLTTATGVQSITHSVGTTPKMVRLNAVYSSSGSGTSTETTSQAYIVTNGTVSSATSLFQHSTNGSATGFDSEHTADFRIRTSLSTNNYYQLGTVAVGSTEISISWTKTGSPSGTAYITWEAEG